MFVAIVLLSKFKWTEQKKIWTQLTTSWHGIEFFIVVVSVSQLFNLNSEFEVLKLLEVKEKGNAIQ